MQGKLHCFWQCSAGDPVRLTETAMQVGNIQLRIPVRVTRRNIEQDAICGAVFIYDGLYNVVSALPCSCLSPMHNFTTPRFS